jgi:hypothetical protein
MVVAVGTMNGRAWLNGSRMRLCVSLGCKYQGHRWTTLVQCRVPVLLSHSCFCLRAWIAGLLWKTNRNNDENYNGKGLQDGSEAPMYGTSSQEEQKQL